MATAYSSFGNKCLSSYINIPADIVLVVGDVHTSLLPELCGPDFGLAGNYYEDEDGELKEQLIGNQLCGSPEYDAFKIVKPMAKADRLNFKVFFHSMVRLIVSSLSFWP